MSSCDNVSSEQLRLWHHAKAGSYLEGWPAATAEELWQRHQERVKELSGERASLVVPHDSMTLRIQFAERCRFCES